MEGNKKYYFKYNFIIYIYTYIYLLYIMFDFGLLNKNFIVYQGICYDVRFPEYA